MVEWGADVHVFPIDLKSLNDKDMKHCYVCHRAFLLFKVFCLQYLRKYIFRTGVRSPEAMEIHRFPPEIHSFSMSTELLKR